MKEKLDLFSTVRSPYYIFAADYRQTSAGIRCLHYLCHALNELGQEAYLVNTKVVSSFLRTPCLTKEVVSRHFQSGRTPIALYPEVVSGNPLNAPVVARWLLNVPGHLGGDSHYKHEDILFYYNRWCLPEGMAGTQLYIPPVDTRLFNNYDNEHEGSRTGACFYAHKYLAFGGKVNPEHTALTSLCHDIPRTPEEIAAILRRSQVLYCYEPSAIITEALACGCPVLMVQSAYWKPGSDDPHLAVGGIALADAPSALEKARHGLGDAVTAIEQQKEAAWLQIDQFVQLTQAGADSVPARQSATGADYVSGFIGVKAAQASPEIQRFMTDSIKAGSLPRSALDLQYGIWKTGHAHDWGSLLDSASHNRDQGGESFRVVIPLFDGLVEGLAATLESIMLQTHVRWSVTILSTMVSPEGFQNTDELQWLVVPGGNYIEMLNQVVGQGDFDWLAVMRAGDRLAPHALSTVAIKCASHPEWSVVYPDEDTFGAGQELPYFKSEFSIEALRSAPYTLSGGLLFKRSSLIRLDGLKEAFQGVELFDMMLRAYEALGADAFGHIADVLYHRLGAGNGELSPEDVVSLRHKALVEHFERLAITADVEQNVLPGTFRIRYRFDDSVTVSIVIPTMNGGTYLQRCIGAIVENTDYKNWELIVVDQSSDDPETLKFLELLPQMGPDTVRVLKQPRTASLPAMINAGAKLARGQYLLFMADATAPLRRDWLDEMLGYASQPDIGVVGAKMIGPDANVSFAGYVLGLEGLPAGLHDLHAPPDALGYFGMLQVPNNPSAVSATCMLTGKTLFEQLGGFDEQALAGGFSDVDYCLKSWQAGRRVVWTPFALVLQEHMYAPQKKSPVDDEEEGGAEQRKRVWNMPTPEAQVMFDRWRDRIAFDPAYNRNLSLVSGAFEIETIPALTWDPEFRPVPRILGLTGDRTGSGEYRVIAPMRALANAARIQGYDTNEYLSVPELARMSPDVIVFQRQVKPHQVALIELYQRNSNAFRVFELDDLMTNIQLGNQARQGYLDKDLVKRFRRTLGMCDRFVVSTDYLAEEFRKYKPEIRVAQNRIERAKWGGLAPKRRQGRKPRVGWAGSITHETDLAIVADVVKALADEVEWVFFGLCPEGVRMQVEYHAGVPIEEYPAKLASLNLDLAIAPLEDVPFNHGKSHLRLLEYGVLGYPVICTDITPYRGAYPVARVKNRFKDWVEAIREHVSDLDELARRGDVLRDYINANWLLEDGLDSWLDAWLPD